MEGITLNTFRHYESGASKQDLRHITMTEVQHIYDVGYFQPIGGASLSQGVAMVAFDYCVNSGKGKALNVLAKTSSISGAVRVRSISNARLSFLEGLKTWRTFGKGWGSRVGQCEAIGIKWEASSPVIAQAEIQVSVNGSKKRAKAHTAVVVASSSTSTAVTAPVAISPAKSQLSLGAAVTIGGLLIVVALVCGFLAYQHSQRATALKAA